METKGSNRDYSSFATGGFADTREKIKFLGDEGAEKQHVDPEDLVLSQT